MSETGLRIYLNDEGVKKELFIQNDYHVSDKELEETRKKRRFLWMDYVDPIVSFNEFEDKIVVDNGFAEYTYLKKHIHKWKIEDLKEVEKERLNVQS